MAWLTGYAYRKQITINHSGAITGYQKKLHIDKSGTSDSGETVQLNDRCQDWPEDIRFTTSDETTLCDFWREESDASDGTWWVEYDQANGDTTLYLYYGKATDSDASSGPNTFEFFDHFATYDTTTNWTTISGSPSASSSVLTLNTAEADSKATWAADHALRAYLKTDHFNNSTVSEIVFLSVTDGSVDAGALFAHTANQGTFRSRSGGTQTTAITGWTAGAYGVLEIQRNSTTNVIYTINDADAVTHATRVPAGNAKIRLCGLDYALSKIYVDWVLMRNYTATEPTCTWGTETAAGGTVIPNRRSLMGVGT